MIVVGTVIAVIVPTIPVIRIRVFTVNPY